MIFILLVYLYRARMAGIWALAFWTVVHLRRRRSSLETSLGICVRVWTQGSYALMMFACMLYLAAVWWMADQTCMRCPHGFVGSDSLIFAGACFVPKCVLEVAETTRRAAVADIELPLRSDPIRWPNEWRLPLGQVAPNCLPFLLALRPPMYQAIAFHEQSGDKHMVLRQESIL